MRILLLLAVFTARTSADLYFYEKINEFGTALVPELFDDLDLDTEMRDILEPNKSGYGGRSRDEFDEDIEEALVENIIPELCELSADNCTIYNSFVLDCNCVEEFEKLDPGCRRLPCHFVTHALEHGPKFIFDLFTSRNIEEILQVVNAELKTIFESYDFCACSKQFLKALFGCAKFYNGNILHSYTYSCDIPQIQLALRNLDFSALNKFFDKFIDGLCVDTDSGKCYNSIFLSIENIGGLFDNTLINYDQYYGSGDFYRQSEMETEKFKKKQKKNKNCDNVFRVFDAYDEENDRDFAYDLFDDGPSEEGFRDFFNGTERIMAALYCSDRKCKTDVGEQLYPCCLKDLLNNKKMFDNLEDFIMSIYRTPVVDLDWDGFEHDLSYPYDSNFFGYKIPEELRESFMKTIHPAKYCKTKSPQCFN